MTAEFSLDLNNNDDGTNQNLFGEHGIPNDQLLLVYSLELDCFNDTKMYRCEKYNRLRFTIGPSLYGRDICLMTNYTDDFTQFEREKLIKVDISKPNHCLQLRASGSFHFVYSDNKEQSKILGSFYVVVSPDIMINNPITKKSDLVSINALQCQSVLSKLMGSIDTWKDKLQVSINCHYNMIHWTPIQELGGSNSAYSLANQHRMNPMFRTKDMISQNEDCQLKDVASIIDWLKEQGVISITDIVLNHTANESSWLKEHPESSYNCDNSPWLRPAFLLDRLLWNVTLDIEKGKWSERGITKDINEDYQFEIIRDIIHNEYLPLIKLEEFFLCDTIELTKKFEKLLISKFETNILSLSQEQIKETGAIKIIQDPEYRRLNCTIDLDDAFTIVSKQIDFKQSPNDWIKLALSRFQEELVKLNDQKRKEMKDIIYYAIDNVLKGARYERLDPNGPKVKQITSKHPLATEYFNDPNKDTPITEFKSKELSLYDKTTSCFYMAHNGWVMNDNPLKNFAEKHSAVYLRRELICWGDSVKLRYGEKPEDSPYLWSFMKDYVIQMATTFQGLRLDNCHSTPIHVAQYMLDAARRVNPNLYLIAELFTSSEELDNIFVNKLGINSLIREAMSASTPYELQRQVYRFGGEPVGSFLPDNLKTKDDNGQTGNLYSRPLVPSTTHAIFFDQTHDNESPIVRRSAYDPLPSSALVSMTYSATGSNRGYDELVPHHIHVVHEIREYRKWTNDGLNLSMGIISGKRILNQLHHMLNSQGYSQAFVDNRDRDTIVITRHNPVTHKSVVLAARTAFYPLDHPYAQHLEPLRIEGKFERILFEIKMDGTPDKNFEQDPLLINGYSTLRSIVNVSVDKDKSDMVHIDNDGDLINQIHFKNFPPSSVIAFSFDLLDHQKQAILNIKEQMKQFDSNESVILRIVNKLDLLDLNYVLFRSNQEEIDESGGNGGAYSISNGPFVYCGLAGIMFHLTRIRTNNDLGHPLCVNLRDGNWLPEYIVRRLERHSTCQELARWLQESFKHLSKLPRYLIPRYFDVILCPLYSLLLSRVWIIQSNFVRNGDELIKRLSLGGVALIGSHPPSPLPPLETSSHPKSFSSLNFQYLPTMAAGLPHFSSGYMRNWGRDTFISLKGLTLITGRFDVAKVIILGFAGCLRHGLIPNLLDGGRNSRFNCRDAVWWWLQAIKEYIQFVPDGHTILNENVKRLFPHDDSPPLMMDGNDNVEPLHKTMQEALNRHFEGIDFVERNAGTQIDAHMTKEGFHVKIGVDRSTGFVYGGNRWNCGTWMDKMGSSDKAGNRGQPATPRDGSAVELIGLSKSILSFLSELHKKNLYPYEGVTNSNVGESWSFQCWSEKIKENFEKHYHISNDCTNQYVNRRQIYKDTCGSSIPWADFQLRPNFLITMAIAPELFNKEHAIEALNVVSNNLVGPLGMKTLDPSDWKYRGDYDNSNDFNDPTVAHGFNYHNGPEWLWLMGYYLMARLKFNNDPLKEIELINKIVCRHFEELLKNEWFGLPELTNSDGHYCGHSCPIQSWSHATLIEALYLKYQMIGELCSK